MDNHDTGGRIALLSNVNMNAVIRALGREMEIYEAEGYGNELGLLMNPGSSYHAFDPDITFVVTDLMELLDHRTDEKTAETLIENWFASFESALRARGVYYVNDAWLWGPESEADALTDRSSIERIWDDRLHRLCKTHANVRILPYHRMIAKLGEENAFSLKMWYMGRILLSGEAGKRLAALMADRVRLERRTPKKVLILDLDNVLWGGLAGEHDQTPIALSEEHAGLAYKNLQRVIDRMERQGVILAIVSKNNPEDAEEILQHHPHMVLRPEQFAAKRINWRDKSENIKELAEELNLSTDSFVFWDDSPEERLLVSRMLPEVTVPDFPERVEDLAPAMTAVYHNYFEKAALTAEDLQKTAQYADNGKREDLRQSAGSFEEYLRQLRIVVTREEPTERINRLTDLLNKTNQFNLTTKRHDMGQVQSMVEDAAKRVFLYGVRDCFGDYGTVAAVIADVSKEIPVLEEFVMSCRVMGKNIEQGILSHVEDSLRREGFERVRGMYIPTARNRPVAQMYEQAGYHVIQQETGGTAETDLKVYELALDERPRRSFVGEVRDIGD
ncbi:MAG: HAD-IIIC family phosphatase [Clostridium sp.]|nr:HAD-IIIC family phosphatase [Acetatifactor muris]MCM1525910.1 HAD-IIIC family phosphatase [Bacteroides sp.]MCM1562551.1 HAD-IIIC family phosphatase [Clostridium sp.]